MNRKSLKTILSLLLILSLVMLFSACVKKEEPGISEEDKETSDGTWTNIAEITLGSKISGTGAGYTISGNTVTITQGGDYTITGTLSDGMINVNSTEKVKLRLKNISITNPNGPAIMFANADKAFITLVEGTTNLVTDGANYTMDGKAAIFSNDDLEIKGKGKLIVSASFKHAIASDDDLTIKNGDITISAATDGLHANNIITVDGGNILINSSSDGIDTEDSVIINGGTLNISAVADGVHAVNDVTISGGTIDIKKSKEGIEGKRSVTINNGKINVVSANDAINSGSDLIINNGTIIANGGDDAIDANSNLTINGGTVIAFGANNVNNSLDVNKIGGKLILNGGTIFGTGGSETTVPDASSAKSSIMAAIPFAANTLLNISDKNGNEMITLNIPNDCSNIIFSSDALTSGTEYVISSGGSHSGKVEKGFYTGGSYTGGTKIASGVITGKNVIITKQ